VRTKPWLVALNEDSSEYLGGDIMMELRWKLEKQGLGMRTGFIWLGI
jgi:hypothetical protein